MRTIIPTILGADEASPNRARPTVSQLYQPLDRCTALSEPEPDPLLEREVARFAGLSQDLMTRLATRPLVLSRHVATPNREMARFLALAHTLGRPPLVLTMTNDRFMPDYNPSKRRLAKVVIETGPRSTQHVSVVAFNQMRGKRFSETQCLDGTPFLRFHEDLLAVLLGPAATGAVFDGTPFWRSERPRQAYPRFFALFTCFGVLAESYSDDAHESSFTDEVILPSFEATVARFGVPPRICQLLPDGEALEPSWDYYPSAALPYVLRAAGRAHGLPEGAA